MKKMFPKTCLLALGLSLLCLQGIAQEINSFYVYGCENCKITGAVIVGKHKVLLDYSNESNRKLILLDSHNLATDQIEVRAPIRLTQRNAHSFLVPDQGCSAHISIKNDRFEVANLFMFLDGFAMDYPILTYNGVFGRVSYEVDPQTYIDRFGFMKGDSFQVIKYKSLTPDYNTKGKEVMAFTTKHNGKELNPGLEFDLIVNNDLQEERRCERPFKWDSYEMSGDTLFLFSRSFQKWYAILAKEKEGRLLQTIRLPLEFCDEQSWSYFYDQAQKLHYFVSIHKEILPQATELVRKSRKTQAPPSVYTYELYRLNESALERIGKIPYFPEDIEDHTIYELRGSGKSFHLYGYPLVERPEEFLRVNLMEN